MRELPVDLLTNCARSSMEQVFSTMLDLVAEPGTPETRHDGLEACGGVMALVGIAGTWTGAGRLLVSPKLACILAGALLMSTFDGVDDEVLDAIGEIANMVVGNVKTMLEEELGALSLSIPTVIFGKNYTTHSGKVQDWLVIPFQSHGETIELRFCLMPARTNARAGFQVEMHRL
jgi:chemotaxis protein CheX